MTSTNPKRAGDLHKYGFAQADSVWSVNGVCPCIVSHLQGQMGHQINILEENHARLPDTAREKGG